MPSRPRLASSPTPAKSRSLSFDIAFGFVLPIACLLLDPGIIVVGRDAITGGLGPPILARYACAIYALIVPSIAILAVWLALRRGAVFLAGPLLAGSAISLAIGIALLPLSLPMCLFGIGLLGLVPFGTAVSYALNGVRAWRAARVQLASGIVLAAAAVLFGAMLALCWFAQSNLDARVDAVIRAAANGTPSSVAEAVARLKPIGWLAADQIAMDAWRRAGSSAGGERLAQAWHAATGRTLLEVID